MTVPDPADKPLAVGICYPSNDQLTLQPLAMFTQPVAANEETLGNRLPLILMSSPLTGSLASNYDTALALAQAGFVVVSLTRSGFLFYIMGHVA